MSLLSDLLKEQCQIVAGCTELGAIGLAVSLSYHALQGKLPTPYLQKDKIKSITDREIKYVKLTIDRNVFKNAFAARLPKINHSLKESFGGIELSAACGLLCDPSLRLNLFTALNPAKIRRARALVKRRKVRVRINPREVISPFVRAEVKTRYGTAITLIQHSHTNVTLIKLNRRVLYRAPAYQRKRAAFTPAMRRLASLKIRELIKLVDKISRSDIEFLRKGIMINLKASQSGLKKSSGLGTGAALDKFIKEKEFGASLITDSQIATAAAIDTRMGGELAEIMCFAGSGNQGITCSLPLLTLARKTKWNEKRLIKSVSLAFLLTCYLTCYTGYLSPICGCVAKAGISAAAGIVYYLKGTPAQIEAAIKNMVGDISGIICDGAKPGCALKIASAVGAAYQAAALALNGVEIPAAHGIVAITVEETIKNMDRVSSTMIDADKKIVQMLKRETERIVLKNL